MSKIYENIEILIKVQFILVTLQRPILRKKPGQKMHFLPFCCCASESFFCCLYFETLNYQN